MMFLLDSPFARGEKRSASPRRRHLQVQHIKKGSQGCAIGALEELVLDCPLMCVTYKSTLDYRPNFVKNCVQFFGGFTLAYIKKLYKVEHKAKDEGMSPEERLRLRHKEARPILSSFHDWLRKRSSQVPPKSLIGKAISYTLSQWGRLTAYLKDGILSMDNNAAENAIRPFVVGRKNWLFAGTTEGAEASALFYSLIETARANGLEPYGYLRYIFSKLPLAQKIEDYEALLPWNLTPEAIKI